MYFQHRIAFAIRLFMSTENVRKCHHGRKCSIEMFTEIYLSQFKLTEQHFTVHVLCQSDRLRNVFPAPYRRCCPPILYLPKYNQNTENVHRNREMFTAIYLVSYYIDRAAFRCGKCVDARARDRTLFMCFMLACCIRNHFL